MNCRSKDQGSCDRALAAYVPQNHLLEDLEPGLEETAFYDPSSFAFPSGAYGCDVALDPVTGKIDFMRFFAADDFGNIVGAIGSPPAAVHAAIGALHRAGHTHITQIDMPLTPSRVWAAMNR